jgi:hypothetical protein
MERVGRIDNTDETRLRAGFSRIDITPAKSLPMGGYIERSGNAAGTHDPLYARASAISDGESSAILLALDLLCVSHEWARKLKGAISDRIGVPRDSILVAATHTHSGPAAFSPFANDDVDISEYETGLAAKCVEAAEKAHAAMEPARLRAHSEPVEGVSANRRDRSGSIDDVLSVVRVENPDGVAIGHLASFSCHATIMGPANLEYSADLFGAAAAEVENRCLGSVCLLFNGCAADASTRFVRRTQDWVELARLGEMLGRRIISAGENSSPVAGNIIAARASAMKIAFQDIPGPEDAQREYEEASRKISETALDVAQGGAPKTDDRLARSLLEGAVARLFLSKMGGWRAIFGTDEADIELQVIRIGDLIVCALPGEFFAERAARLRETASPSFGLVAGYANGYWGYFVPPHEAAKGGYETMMAPLSSRHEPEIIEEVERLIEETKEIGRGKN